MKSNQTFLSKFTILAILILLLGFAQPKEVSFIEKKFLHLHNPNAFTDTSKVDKNIKRITDSLESINQRLPIEKVYLHTDKPFYSVGDTIWFKAYLVENNNHMASNISNVLYVELVDANARLVDRISIRIKDGVGWGQIPVRNVQYQDGEYMLRAYTMWMQNFSYDYIFSRRFFIGTQAEDAWLVKSDAAITLVEEKNQLQVSLLLNRLDKLSSPVSYKEVEVKIYDGINIIFSENMQTRMDGSLNFTRILKDRMNGRRIRIQLMSLDPKDNNKIVQVPLVINRSNKIDLQFLPEGGKLVAGIKSTVGFKAVGEDGRGTGVAGSVFDSKGIKIASFNSLHGGMGSLELTPAADETYTARIEQPTGITEAYSLPKPEPFGTVLHVSNPEKATDIKITLAGLNNISLDSGFYLIGTARGEMNYSRKIEKGQTALFVPKRLFPSGIARFTLFNGMTPLNERIVFIDHRDGLQITVTPQKLNYAKRDSVSLLIEVRDKNGNPVQGDFSMSVTDDSQVKADSVGDFGIAASLQITAGLKGDYGINVLQALKDYKLKGEIESPGFYLNRKDSLAWEALDKLMLTQGWTDYDWKRVFSEVKVIRFKAQNNFDITGRVVNALNKPIAGANVIAFSQKPPFVKKMISGVNGRFVFKDLLKIDSGSYFFQGTKRNGKPMTLGEIAIDRPFSPWYTPAAYRYPIIPWYVNSDTTLINQALRKSAQLNANNPKITGTLLEEVNIRSKKIIPGSWNPYGAGNADYVFDEHDIKRSGLNNLYDFFMQKIPGIRIYGSWDIEEKSILGLMFNDMYLDTKIDGNPLTIGVAKIPVDRIEELTKYQLASIRGIELIYTTKYTNGIYTRPKLIITTYHGKGGLKNLKGAANAYRPLPITIPRLFYSPKYKLSSSDSIPDYRTTIHWEPNIRLDQNGKATVSFYTSDSSSSLTLNIQGTSFDGGIGSIVRRLN